MSRKHSSLPLPPALPHPLEVQVNGESVSVEVTPGTTLLALLRGLGLHGTKLSCGRGECGACTVLVDGRPVLACTTLAVRVDAPVTTVEGLAEEFSELRTSFARCAGFQCGFCTPGQIVTAAAAIGSDSVNTDEGIRNAMSGNLCRCTGYSGIVESVKGCLPTHSIDEQDSSDEVGA